MPIKLTTVLNISLGITEVIFIFVSEAGAYAAERKKENMMSEIMSGYSVFNFLLFFNIFILVLLSIITVY